MCDLRLLIFKISISLLFLTNGAFVYAQDAASFSIFFRNNIDEISFDGQKRLDLAIRSLSHRIEFYNVEIKGFTDTTGSINTNLRLSKQRAEKVAEYFRSKQFLPEQIIDKGMGMIVDTISKDQGNERRVEIRIFLVPPKLNLPQDSLIGFQREKIDAALGSVFKTYSDGMIDVRPNSFVNDKGEKITGTVDLFYREYRLLNDVLARELPSSNNGNLVAINQEGEFELRFYKNEKEVWLAPNQTINVYFGVNSRKPYLNFYKRDEEKGFWRFIRSVTDNEGNLNDHYNPIAGCGGTGKQQEENCANMDDCNRLAFLKRIGTLYATSEKTIREKMKDRDSLQLYYLLPAKNILDSVTNLYYKKGNEVTSAKSESNKLDYQWYQIERSEVKRARVVVHLRNDATEFNEINELKGVDLKLKGRIPDSLFTVFWNEGLLKLNRTGSGRLTLVKSGKKLVIDVQKLMQSKAEDEKYNISKSYRNYKKFLKVKETEKQRRHAIVDALVIRRNEIEIERQRAIFVHDSIGKQIDYFVEGEFECLYYSSKPYMSKVEDTLKLDEWIEFFDKNKSLMINRYNSIKGDFDPDFVRNCIESDEKRQRMLLNFVAINVNAFHGDSLAREKAKEKMKTPLYGIFKLNEAGVYSVALRSEITIYLDNKDRDVLNIKGYYLNDSVEVKVKMAFVMPKYLENDFYLLNGTTIASPYKLPKTLINSAIILVSPDGNLFGAKYSDYLTKILVSPLNTPQLYFDFLKNRN